MEKERIIERIYNISEKTHRTKLLPETLEEVINDSNILFDSKELDTAIFKEIITMPEQKGFYTIIAKKYNIQNPIITKIQYKMVDKMYLSDSKRRFEKMSYHEKLEADISLLGLDNKTTDILSNLNCKRVLDIFYLNEKTLQNKCIERGINCKRISERLQVLGIEQVVQRIFKLSQKNGRKRALPETILEIFANSKTLFDSNEKYTEIFRRIITSKNQNGIQYELAKEYNVKHQRVSQIYLNMLERMFLKDTIIRFEKFKTNDEKLETSIDNLNIDKKTHDLLIELHCRRIKDIFEIDEQYLEDIFLKKNVDYKNLKNRLDILKIEKPKKTNHLVSIEELTIPLVVYKHLKNNHINTTHDLMFRINDLMLEPSIPEDVKKQIRRIYDTEIDKLDYCKETSLLVQRQLKEESLKRTQQAQEMLQEKIEMYLEYLKKDLSPQEQIVIRRQLKYLLETVEKNSERISEKEEKLKKISKYTEYAHKK